MRLDPLGRRLLGVKVRHDELAVAELAGRRQRALDEVPEGRDGGGGLGDVDELLDLGLAGGDAVEARDGGPLVCQGEDGGGAVEGCPERGFVVCVGLDDVGALLVRR